MHNLRARKRPPPRGEEGAGLRGERPLAGDAVAIQDNVSASIGIGEQALDLKHPNDNGALTRSELGGVAYTAPDHGDARSERDELRAERVQRLEHSHLVVTHEHGERLHGRAVELVPALTGGHAGVGGKCAGFCCVCHAHDTTPTRGTCATLRRLEFSGHPYLPRGRQLTERNAAYARRARRLRLECSPRSE